MYDPTLGGRPPGTGRGDAVFTDDSTWTFSTEPRDILRTITWQQDRDYALEYAEANGWDYETLVADDPCEPVD